MCLISHQLAVGIGVIEDDPTNLWRGHSFGLHRASLAAALYKGDDLHLVAIPTLALPAKFGMQNPGRATFLVAIEGLVNFKSLPFAAQRARAAFVHRQPNAVADEPAGFEIDTENAAELIRAEALLARTHQVDRLQPDVQRDMARLEDGPDLDGERLPAGVALVNADAGALALKRSGAINDAAFRANPTVRPELRLDVGVSSCFAAETGFVKDRLWHRLSPCRRIYNASHRVQSMGANGR